MTNTTPSPAPTLDGRLLCASVCAYDIGIPGKGTYHPTTEYQIYYNGAGFLDTPTSLASGPLLIDAALVATTVDGVVLAFRGTIPPALDLQSILDWIFDAVIEPKSVPNIPGKVHAGFWDDLSSLWTMIVPEVKNRMAATGKKLIVTGHSKGGSLATLAAIRFNNDEQITADSVHTFAAARAGDVAFKLAYEQIFPGNKHLRWEFQDDIVPHLPPTLVFVPLFAELQKLYNNVLGTGAGAWAIWNYASCGMLRFIDWSGKIVSDSVHLEFHRFEHLAKLIIELDFKKIASDHSSKCTGGYMTYIVPTGVCPVADPKKIATLIGPEGMRVLATSPLSTPTIATKES